MATFPTESAFLNQIKPLLVQIDNENKDNPDMNANEAFERAAKVFYRAIKYFLENTKGDLDMTGVIPALLAGSVPVTGIAFEGVKFDPLATAPPTPPEPEP